MQFIKFVIKETESICVKIKHTYAAQAKFQLTNLKNALIVSGKLYWATTKTWDRSHSIDRASLDSSYDTGHTK